MTSNQPMQRNTSSGLAARFSADAWRGHILDAGQRRPRYFGTIVLRGGCSVSLNWLRVR
jgi:hypothetical protein